LIDTQYSPCARTAATAAAAGCPLVVCTVTIFGGTAPLPAGSALGTGAFILAGDWVAGGSGSALPDSAATSVTFVRAAVITTGSPAIRRALWAAAGQLGESHAAREDRRQTAAALAAAAAAGIPQAAATGAHATTTAAAAAATPAAAAATRADRVGARALYCDYITYPLRAHQHTEEALFVDLHEAAAPQARPHARGAVDCGARRGVRVLNRVGVRAVAHDGQAGRQRALLLTAAAAAAACAPAVRARAVRAPRRRVCAQGGSDGVSVRHGEHAEPLRLQQRHELRRGARVEPGGLTGPRQRRRLGQRQLLEEDPVRPQLLPAAAAGGEGAARQHLAHRQLPRSRRPAPAAALAAARSAGAAGRVCSGFRLPPDIPQPRPEPV
jgi:hypothetical protein